jgi:tRNA-dihydrouridine synthase
VWALKRDFPHLAFSLNGQVEGCHAAAAALATPVPAAPAPGEQPVPGGQPTGPAPQHGPGRAPEPGPEPAPGPGPGGAGGRLEGVMIGRAAYSAPWAALADADVAVWGAPANAAACRRQARPPLALRRPAAGAGRGPAGAGVCTGDCAAAAALRCCRAGPAAAAPAARRARRRAARQRARARAQVLERYAAYGDGVLGCWGARPDGSRAPGVRALAKPLLGLFHGEPGGRRFRCALEDGLRRKPASLSALLQARACARGGASEAAQRLCWLSQPANRRHCSTHMRQGPCVKT